MTGGGDLPGDVVVAATIEARHRDGRCDQCGPDGCELLDWSLPRLAAHRAARPWSAR